MAVCLADHSGFTGMEPEEGTAATLAGDPLELANHIENAEDKHMFYISCIAAYEFLGFDTPAACRKIKEEFKRYASSAA